MDKQETSRGRLSTITNFNIYTHTIIIGSLAQVDPLRTGKLEFIAQIPTRRAFSLQTAQVFARVFTRLVVKRRCEFLEALEPTTRGIERGSFIVMKPRDTR
jgi:hypothetical protein